MNFKPLKNQRGAMSLEYVIGFLIYMVIFCFIYDLMMITIQRHQLVTLTQNLTRIVQVQGGTSPTIPFNYHGTESTYLNSDEITSRVAQLIRRTGGDDTTLEIRISGVNEGGARVDEVLTSTSNIQLKYQTPFTVTVSYDFRWRAASNFMSGTTTSRQQVSSVGLTEYKRDYDYWDKEW